MKYSEAYHILTRLTGGDTKSMAQDKIKYLEDLGLIQSITSEQYVEYETIIKLYSRLERRLSLGIADREKINNERVNLAAKHNSKWHRFWSRKNRLNAEKKRLKNLERILTTKKSYVGDMTERLKEIKYDNDYDPASSIPSYSQTSDYRYVTITQLGSNLKDKLKESNLRNNEDFKLNIAFLDSNDSEIHGFSKEFYDNLPDGMLVSLLPDIIYNAEKFLKKNPLDREQAVTGFLGGFNHISAVPYLIDALKSEALLIEKLKSKVIDETSWTEHFDEEGTFGGYEGESLITADVVDVTYRQGSPIVEGTKIALSKIMDNHSDLKPKIKNQIEEAIAEYEANLPPATYTEQILANERYEDLWRRKTVDNR